MRIAYIDPHPVPGPGVEALQIAQNVDAFARGGDEVCLVTPEPPAGASVGDLLGRPWHPGLHPSYVPDYRTRWWAPSRSNQMFFAAARRWLRRERPDAVWSRHLRCAAAVLAMRDGPPVIFETHEVFACTLAEQPGASRRKVCRLRRLEQRVYAGSRGIIALTAGLADDLRVDYRDTAPILVAADGADAILAARADPVRAGDEPVILYLGSLHAWKGVDTVIRAMRGVPIGTLVIAGGDAQAVQRVRKLAEAESVADRVRTVGAVPPRQRFDWIAAATLCVLPLSQSRIAARYTSPLKLFEYLTLGKPVIVADLPTTREVLEHDRNAWLVPRIEPEDFAEAINRLLADAELRARLAAGAAELGRAHTWDARAAKIRRFMIERLGAGAA